MKSPASVITRMNGKRSVTGSTGLDSTLPRNIWCYLTKLADTKMESGYSFQQEQLLLALERDAVCNMLMCNPRVTGFTSFAKAVLNFIDDKKAPRTKKNLYDYLVKKGYYNNIHKFSWSKR